MFRKKKKDDEPDEPDPDKFSCEFCHKSFNSVSAANNHMKRKVCKESRGILTQTQDASSSLTCSECGAGPYSRASDLNRHVR